MHRIKYFILLLLLVSIGTSAQQLTNQDWSTDEDYRASEEIVLENIVWLENHPLATSSNDTKALSEYVLNWVSGSPYISVTYNEMFLIGLTNSKKYKFGEKFRVTYLLGKSYYLIENQKDPDEARACARGIEGMVSVYNELKKIDPSVKHSLLEKYSRLVKKEKTVIYAQSLLDKAAEDKL